MFVDHCRSLCGARPQLQRLIAAIERAEIGIVAVSGLTRFGVGREVEALVRACASTRYHLVTATRELDADVPEAARKLRSGIQSTWTPREYHSRNIHRGLIRAGRKH